MPQPSMLAPHFSVREFIHTIQRDLLDDQERAWTANPSLYANGQRLCVSLLERFRTRVGALFVSSGYRCELLNRAVRGSGSRPGQKPSAHLQARAADVVPLRVNVVEAMDRIREALLAGGLPDLDKAILEFGRWIHLQVPRVGEAPARKLLMTFDGLHYPVFNPADPRVVARRAA